MLPSTLTLQVTCLHCLQPVTLQFSNVRTVFNIESLWTCPQADCSRLEAQPVLFPGELVDVWAGHGPEPDDSAELSGLFALAVSRRTVLDPTFADGRVVFPPGGRQSLCRRRAWDCRGAWRETPLER